MRTFTLTHPRASNIRCYLKGLCLIVVLAGVSTELFAQVSVTISPSVLTLATLATQSFTATVTGSTNTTVTWQVNGVAGGNLTTGQVSTTVYGTSNEAIYLGPSSVPSPATISVTAVSQADTTKSATATVTIGAPSRSGVTYYVSTSGNDANAGTLSAPWRTIQHAANTAVAGDTVDIEGGVYNEIVTLPHSGNATTGYITFQSYPGQTATIDGTGLTPTGSPYGYTGGSNLEGLINLGTNSYIVVQGLEVRNFTTSSAVYAVGINFEGAGSNVEILNNHIHNISAPGSGCNSTNALGIAVYGVQAPASINNLTVMGNEIDHNTTGCSENLTMNGNVQYFVEANNYVHDANNICLDDIGFEGKSPQVAYDQARDGWVFQNRLEGCTSTNNPVYHYKVGADGYYCDGCTRLIVERNLIWNSDINEMASEHSGHVSSYVVFRNNIIYNSLYVGLSIGGYSSSVGGTDHCILANNSEWDDGTYGKSGEGEFQIQYNATNNFVYNNIFDNYTLNLYLVDGYAKNSSTPATLDYNLHWSTNGAASSVWAWLSKSITGFSNWQTTSAQDGHAKFADPQYDNIATTPYNFDIASTSPAINAGTNLGQSIVGVLDYAGNPRVNATGQINIGAYEQ